MYQIWMFGHYWHTCCRYLGQCLLSLFSLASPVSYMIGITYPDYPFGLKSYLRSSVNKDKSEPLYSQWTYLGPNVMRMFEWILWSLRPSHHCYIQTILCHLSKGVSFFWLIKWYSFPLRGNAPSVCITNRWPLQIFLYSDVSSLRNRFVKCPTCLSKLCCFISYLKFVLRFCDL